MLGSSRQRLVCAVAASSIGLAPLLLRNKNENADADLHNTQNIPLFPSTMYTSINTTIPTAVSAIIHTAFAPQPAMCDAKAVSNSLDTSESDQQPAALLSTTTL